MEKAVIYCEITFDICIMSRLPISIIVVITLVFTCETGNYGVFSITQYFIIAPPGGKY